MELEPGADRDNTLGKFYQRNLQSVPRELARTEFLRTRFLYGPLHSTVVKHAEAIVHTRYVHFASLGCGACIRYGPVTKSNPFLH